MLKKSLKARSIKSVTTLLSASALAMGVGFSQPVQAADPFIAEIVMFGSNFAPRGWAFCNGQLISISQNTALFSLLGTTYGGDGETTFALPDLRGRSPVHSGGNSAGPGLAPVRLGERGGAVSHTLTQAQMPSHTHVATLNATNDRGNTEYPNEVVTTPASTMEFRNILATKARTNIYKVDPPATGSTTTVPMSPSSITVGNAGGNQSFNIRNPYLGINFIIATQGVFPSPN